jgi:hypothetical protein
MIYHKWSPIGFMLWPRYGLFMLQQLRRMTDVYASHLESPGTKAYSVSKAQNLCRASTEVEISKVLTHGDLLEGGAGQRQKGLILTIARRL